MTAAWRWVVGVLFWLYISTRYYQLHSRFHRWAFEGKFKDITIRTYEKLEQLPVFLERGKFWRSDSWLELFDVVSSPQRVQALFDGVVPFAKHNVDCDEHSIYLCAAITASKAAGKMQDSPECNPKFFTVFWVCDDWSPNGHNVCLLEVPRAGLPPVYCYMDYGMPYPSHPTIADVAADVVARMAGKPAKCVGWAVQDGASLKPEKVWRY